MTEPLKGVFVNQVLQDNMLYMLWLNFILGLDFISLCCLLSLDSTVKTLQAIKFPEAPNPPHQGLEIDNCIKANLDGTIFAYNCYTRPAFVMTSWQIVSCNLDPQHSYDTLCLDVVSKNSAFVDGQKSWHVLLAHDSHKQISYRQTWL